MTIQALYVFCHPLIDILGTICLIALIAASMLYAIVWIVKLIWRYVLTAGALAILVVILGSVLGVL